MFRSREKCIFHCADKKTLSAWNYQSVFGVSVKRRLGAGAGAGVGVGVGVGVNFLIFLKKFTESEKKN